MFKALAVAGLLATVATIAPVITTTHAAEDMSRRNVERLYATKWLVDNCNSALNAIDGTLSLTDRTYNAEEFAAVVLHVGTLADQVRRQLDKAVEKFDANDARHDPSLVHAHPLACIEIGKRFPPQGLEF